MNHQHDRALGALYGLAMGDALGMPTQIMSRRSIVARFGTVTGFEPGPADNPVAPECPPVRSRTTPIRPSSSAGC